MSQRFRLSRTKGVEESKGGQAALGWSTTRSDAKDLMLPRMENTPEHPLKVLFVCSRNRLRSLTAEEIFSGIPGVQVRSAGTQPEARVVVTEGHIGWADLVFVMEKSHLNRLQLRFPEALDGKQIVVLRIPDDYGFMDPDLIDELKAKVLPHLGLPEA